MKYYDNNDRSRNRKHTVRITLQNEDYKGYIAYEVQGTVLGLNALTSSMFDHLDEEEVQDFVINDCNFRADYECGWFSLKLKNEQGDVLLLSDVEQEEVEDMVVAIEIIDCVVS